MNRYLYNIREFFWPILEPENPNSDELKVNISELPKDEQKLKDFYELTKDAYKEESDRTKTIETKSIVFISSIGIAISLFSVFSKSIFESLQYNIISSIIISSTFIALILYIIMVGYYSMKALERKAYHRISPKQYLDSDFDIKNVIVDYIKNIHKNSRTINNKVDMMVMAQEFYKRASVALFIFIFLISINSIYYRSKPNDDSIKPNIIFFNNMNIYSNDNNNSNIQNNIKIIDSSIQINTDTTKK